MISVLDTDAGIEICLKRSKAAVLKEYLKNSSKVIATDLYKAETANTVRKYIKGGFLTREQGCAVLEKTQNLIDEYIDIDENYLESLHESLRQDHSVYDMLYFTLARKNGAVLLTLDKELRKTAEKEGIEIPHFTDK